MFKRSLRFALILAPILAEAQAPALNWVDAYYGLPGVWLGEHIIVGQDTGLYVLGNNGSVDAVLIRYRAYDGEVQWTTPIDSTTETVALVQRDDGVVVTATTHYGFSQNTGTDVRITAFSTAGNQLWQFTFNDSLDYDDHPTDLTVDDAGNIYACAYTEELPGVPSQYSNITTLKLGPSGQLLWRHTYVHPTAFDDARPASLSLDPAGNVYVAGYVTQQLPLSEDMLVLKYTTTGVRSWEWVYNGNSGFGSHVDRAERVFGDAGGCTVVGTSESQDNINWNDVTLVRLSTTATPVWTTHIDNGDDQFLMDAARHSDGSIYVLSMPFVFPDYREAVARVSSSGSVLWNTMPPANLLGAPSALDVDSAGNAFTCGYGGSGATNDNIAHYTPTGLFDWWYSYAISEVQPQGAGRAITVSNSGAVFCTGMIEPFGISNEHCGTYCLCLPAEGICLDSLAQYTAAPGINNLMSADLDNDGWRDIVVTLPGQAALGVYMGSATGFTAAPNVPIPFVGNKPGEFGDLDQDGDLDLVLPEPNPADEVALVLNQGGVLQYGSMLAMGSDMELCAVGDLDGQNGADILAGRWSAPFLTVKLNNGLGGFTNGAANGFTAPGAVHIADGNGDGNNDILMGRTNQPEVFVLWGNGLGGFSMPQQFNSLLSDPTWARWADVDNDGMKDIVCYSDGGGWSWLRSLGGTSYDDAVFDYTVPPAITVEMLPFGPHQASWFAVSNNGGVHLLNFSSCDRQLHVEPIISAPTSHRISVADWNNDGPPDILAYNSQGLVSLWANCDTNWVPLPVSSAVPVEVGATASPNPARDMVMVNVGSPVPVGTHWELLDMSGRLLTAGSFSEPQRACIPLIGIDPGAYVITWAGNTSRTSVRFIKE